MYFQIFGGSGLLHLIAGHPKVVALVGIAATVALLVAPQGPGRQMGTARYLQQLDKTVATRAQFTADTEAEAKRSARRMLEAADAGEIREAIEYTLRECGSGCVDVTTRAVLADPVLLERVLVLHELDRNRDAAAARAGMPGATR